MPNPLVHSVAWITTLLKRLDARARWRADCRVLTSMSDRELKDVGLTSGDVWRKCRSPEAE